MCACVGVYESPRCRLGRGRCPARGNPEPATRRHRGAEPERERETAADAPARPEMAMTTPADWTFAALNRAASQTSAVPRRAVPAVLGPGDGSLRRSCHEARVCARVMQLPCCVRRGLPVRRPRRPACAPACTRRQPRSCSHPGARTHMPKHGAAVGSITNATRACGTGLVEYNAGGEARGWCGTSHAGRSSSTTLSRARDARACRGVCAAESASVVVWNCAAVMGRWHCVLVAHDPLNRAAAPHVTPALASARVPIITMHTRESCTKPKLAGWQLAMHVHEDSETVTEAGCRGPLGTAAKGTNALAGRGRAEWMKKVVFMPTSGWYT